MSNSDIVQASFADYFRMIQARVRELLQPLSTEQLWHCPHAYGNSIGNLVLHLTGNLHYYIGAQIANTGYIRHRDQEFSDSGKPKESLLEEFDGAIETVIATILTQKDEDWARPYSAEREPETKVRFDIFLRCAGHAYHHVGQMIYLQRELLTKIQTPDRLSSSGSCPGFRLRQPLSRPSRNPNELYGYRAFSDRILYVFVDSKLQAKELTMSLAQPGLEVSAPSTYRENLFNLLAGRDPIEVLGQTASALSDIVARYPAEFLRGRAIQGKWTPNEIIGHLTDIEWVYGYRVRLTLCEDGAAILGFRQDAWVTSLRHNERDPSELVEMFRTLRLLNLSVWRQTSPEDLRRSAQHNERGAESLAVMVQLLAGHDLSHLQQISRYIQALESRG